MKTTRRRFFGLLGGVAAVPLIPKPVESMPIPREIDIPGKVYRYPTHIDISESDVVKLSWDPSDNPSISHYEVRIENHSYGEKGSWS